jgi:hypothetical protein
MKKQHYKDAMQGWEIRDGQTGVHLDTVWFHKSMKAEEIVRSLVSDGFMTDIKLRRIT